MKAFTACLMATAASAFQLTVWAPAAKSQSFLSGRLAFVETATSEWYWGTRAPAMWGEYMPYHEGVAFIEEAYTKWSAQGTVAGTLSKSDGTVYFGLSITPYLTGWDVAMAEFLWMYFPKMEYDSEDENARKPHCTYTGWYMEMFYFYVDIGVSLRECKVGVYDYLIDSGEFACFTSAYSVSEVYYRPVTKLSRYNEGAYDWGWNSCFDYPEFTMHDKEFRSFTDALQSVNDDAQDEYLAE